MNQILIRYTNFISTGILSLFLVITGFAFFTNSSDVFSFLVFITLLPAIVYFLIFNKSFFISFVIFLVPLSVSFETGGGTVADFPAEPLLGVMVLVLSVCWILKSSLDKSVLLNHLTILILAGLLWMIICSMNGEFPGVSLKRCIVRASYIFIFYFLFSQWFSDSDFTQKKLLNGIKLFLVYAIGCIIPVLHGIYFHAKLHFATVSAYLMPRPFFSEHTIYGACLAFVLPMLFIVLFHAKEFSLKNWKFAGLLLLIALIGVGEFLSFSRAAWISIGVAVLFRIFIFFRIRFWMILVLLVSGGIIAYQNYDSIINAIKRNESLSNKGDISEHLMSVTNLQTDASNLERINRWKCALRMAQLRPVTGFGPGSYQFIYGQYQVPTDMTRISTYHGTNGHAHSEIFNSLSEEGIPGMLIYLFTLFAVIAYGLKIIYRSVEKREKLIAMGALLGLITFYVHGFFNAFLDTDKMAVLVFGSIALLVSIGIRQKKVLLLKKNNIGNSEE
jgi:O-antigen ligase